MRQSVHFQRAAGFAMKFGWVLTVFLVSSASLVTATTGCGGSQCKMTCNVSNVCITGGCFHDHNDKCEDYPAATGWTTVWALGSTVRCDETLDASGTVVGLTCKGIAGEATGESCACNYVYTGSTKQCG